MGPPPLPFKAGMVNCTVSPGTPVTGRVVVNGADWDEPVGKLGAVGRAEKSTNPSGRRPALQSTSVSICANAGVAIRASSVAAAANMRFKETSSGGKILGAGLGKDPVI